MKMSTTVSEKKEVHMLIQRIRIYADGRMKWMEKMNRTVLKASAGTGKTYRLSLEFIANLIKETDYRNIVVMTFTKKATAEIKERIYDFLYQIAFEKYNWQDLEKNLKEIYGLEDSQINKEKLQEIYFNIIRNKDEMRIYTIDGFTNRIFKNTIAPFFGIYNFETIDEEDEEFYGNILGKILENQEYFEKFLFLVEEKKEKKEIGVYIEFIKNILKLQNYFILSEEKTDFGEKKEDTSFVNYLEETFEQIEAVAEIKNNGKKGEIKPVTNFINDDFHIVYKEFKNIDEMIKEKIENKREKIEIVIKNWEIFYKGEGFKIKNGRTVKGKEIGNFIEEIDNLKEPFMKSLSKNIFTKKVVPLHEKLIEIAEIIYSIAENEKRKSKRFTHNDVSVYTYKFIFDRELNFVQENGVTKDFLELIGGEIETIMIDEFQDTSVLQWKILSLLMESAKNIICVGDEKQSIYGWRGGEKELFEKLDKIIDGKVENLDKSYRSYKQVIENVNRIYEGYDKKWEYLPVKYRDDEDYQGGYFSYCLREVPRGSGVARTYEDIVYLIKEGKIKNLGKSCILCRTNTQIQNIVKRLNEENIPYTLNNNASILDHEAIIPLYKLIKYFVFHNFIYFLEFMRSDLIGCLNDHVGYLLENKSKIEEYMRDGKRETFSEYVNRQEGATAEKLKKYEEIDKMNRNNLLFSDVLYKIKELKKLAKNLNSKYEKENFSQKIIENFNVTNFYPTNSDIKNIFNFFNILKENDDLFEFVSFMEEEKDKITQVSSSDVEAINLMSIHKSKGLEFDTVFYYKSNTESNKTDDLEVYFEYDEKYTKLDKFLLTFGKYKKTFIDGYYSDIRENNEYKKEMEEINADYVALTRAKKNLLLFFDTNKSGGKGLAKRLIDVYGENEGYECGEITESEKKMEDNLFENNQQTDEKLNRIMPYFSNSKVNFPVKEFKTTLKEEFKRKKGLAIHYYFEHILNNLEEDRKTAKSALLSRYGNMLGKAILTEIISRLEEFISKNRDIYDKKYKVYTEFEIYDSEGNKKIMDRINIDEENKKIYIFDYKTGYEPLENETYIQQIENYKQILDKKLVGEYEIYTRILEV